MALETGNVWYSQISTLILSILYILIFVMGRYSVNCGVAGGSTNLMYVGIAASIIFIMVLPVYLNMLYIGIGKWISDLTGLHTNFRKRETCEGDQKDIQQNNESLQARIDELQQKIDSGEACKEIQQEVDELRARYETPSR